MSKKLRIGIIGAGGISGVHVDGIKAHSDKIECVALCDVVEANLENRAKQLGTQPQRFSDWKEMYQRLGDGLDAVVICLPHHLHAPSILDAAAAGKHILCEKPMCISLAEADKILAAIKQAGVIYMSAHNQLFSPAIKAMKAAIDSGKIGKLRWIKVQDAFAAGADMLVGQWRSKLSHQGGGELIDTGYHPTYNLLHLAGAEVAAVRGTMGRFVHPIEGEDTAVVQVRFANGAIGEIFTSWAMPRPFGTADAHAVGELGQVFASGTKFSHLPNGAPEPTVTHLEDQNAFVAQMGHFADCVLSGAQPPHGPEMGREVLKVILEATESAKGWESTATLK